MSTSIVRFLLMTALAKLYYSTHCPEFVVIFVCVLLCKSKVFLIIVTMIVRLKQDDNCF